MTQVMLFVSGHPRPQPRARFVPGRKRPVAMLSEDAKFWRARVEETAKQAVRDLAEDELQELHRRPLRAVLRFGIPIPLKAPASLLYAAHTKKPDCDNLEKTVLDACNSAGLFRDDSQVYDLSTTKLWVGREECGVEIFFEAGDAGVLTWSGHGCLDVPEWLQGEAIERVTASRL